jgi:heat shock protein HtpX
MTGNPGGLANALEKLGAYSRKVPMQANPSTAHMFIVNPLSGRRFANVFSTHPPLEERIARLRGNPPSGQRHMDARTDQRVSDSKNMWDRLSNK